jgi:5S rRNA maturation endonuclease (ribonuclease M5)
LSTHLKEKQEKIRQILEALVEESAKGIPVVVEGKKDVETLRGLGVHGPILCVKTGGKSFTDVLHEIETSGVPEIILLLDFDRRGRQGTARLRQNLERTRIRLNVEFWHELSGLLRHEVQCIESLSSYLETLTKKTGIM